MCIMITNITIANLVIIQSITQYYTKPRYREEHREATTKTPDDEVHETVVVETAQEAECTGEDMSALRGIQRVAIIGAGPSGLATAK